MSAFCALACLMPLGCGDDEGSPTDPGATGEPAAIEVSPASLSFAAFGDSTQLTAVVSDAAGGEIADATVTWTNVDPAVATVNGDGWVVAQGNGTAGVIASAGELADTVTVTVDQVPATLAVSPAEVTAAQSETVQLAAAVADANGIPIEGEALESVAVEWTSADPEIATVDGSGLVTAVRGGGRTELTAAAGSATGTATLEVLDRLLFTRIASADFEIFIMNADGTGATNLTKNGTDDLGASWSPDGTRFAYFAAGVTNSLAVLSANGGAPVVIGDSVETQKLPAWSPDGTAIAFARAKLGISDIWVANADGSALRVLTDTTNSANATLPVWSPDGSRIAFVTDRDGNFEVYVMNADGSGETRLTNAPESDIRPAWSPDGTHILFTSNRDGDLDIYVMNPDGSGVTNLSKATGDAGLASWSPDGSKIAFLSDRTGRFELYIMNADGTGQTRMTSGLSREVLTGAGAAPRWSPDGTRIAFTVGQLGSTLDLYVANADGSGVTPITTSGTAALPTWRPWK